MSARRTHLHSRWKKRHSKENNTNLNMKNCSISNNTCLSDIVTNPFKTQSNDKQEDVYIGWDLFFFDEKYNSSILQKVQAMQMFFKSNPELIDLKNLKSIFKIDINLLYNSAILLKNWFDFKSELKNKPEYCLNCIKLAIYKNKVNELRTITKIIDTEIKNSNVIVRILNYEPIVSLKNIKINYYGKLITVRGCIIRANRSYHMPLLVIFKCNKCNFSYSIKQKNGIYVPKYKCDFCGNMKFEADLSSSYIKTIPIQIIRLQDHFHEESDQGQIPRVMDIELCEDLIDTCMPGDDVTITGIIKMQGIDNGKTKFSTICSLYIEAISVVNNSSKMQMNGSLNIELNTYDYKLIKDIYQNTDALNLLVHSLCPDIYGHEMIKMAYLLSLFGGSSNHVKLRSNIHILVIGDPGLGKSQMLQTCAHVAPKGIYISGNCSTSSGLTVTLIKESGQNDFALEPGALVLADGGCCCIDEFDKMSSQHQALLEAMEQQCVSVAKSGVMWSLPSRTSILAAANPVDGCYNKSKTLSNNLNMSQSLLSRFDLIFLLLDEPNKEMDNFLSGHIMLMHNNNEEIINQKYKSNSKELHNQMNSLRNRLITKSQFSSHTVSSSLLRKYILYARQYVKPTLSSASATVLQKFYLNLRKNINLSKSITSCNRQLEALIRLTEARAKLDLREETTEQDAMDVIELMQNTILPLNYKNQDYTFLQFTKTCKSPTKTFFKLLVNNTNKRNNSLYSIDELKNLGVKEGLVEIDVSLAIEKLNDQGYLIKKTKNLYHFCTN